MKKLNLKNDIIFKAFFSRKGNEEFLIDFLKALLRIEIKKIVIREEVNILDYEMLGFEEYISETAIVLDKHREYEVLKGIKWYFVELPKFRKVHPDMTEKINQWLAFIDDYDKEAIRLAEKNNKTIEKARYEMNYLTGDAAVRRLAELREDWEMDRNSDIYYAKEEGRKEGKEEGKEEGRKEGKEEGRKEGKKEAIKEVTKRLLGENIDIKEIIKITELTKEEIEKIKEEVIN